MSICLSWIISSNETTHKWYKKGEYIMTKRTVEHEIKLEKSVKVILGVLAFGVFLNAFAPVFDVRNAFAIGRAEYKSGVDGPMGGVRFPVHIICDRGCK
jgi:hypothetical protein